MLEELAEILGEEHALSMGKLITQRVRGDKRLPAWFLARKVDTLYHLYAQIPGVSLEDLVTVLEKIPDESTGAVLRRSDHVLVPLLGEASKEDLFRLLPAWRSLTPAQQEALADGKHGAVVKTMLRHKDAVPWSGVPPTEHLLDVTSSTREAQEVYFTLLRDAAGEHSLRYAGSTLSRDRYRELLDLATHLGG